MTAPLVRLSLLLVLASACLGCGAKAYEARLEETKKYFDFLAMQNANLTREWRGGGVTMRVPAHFQELKAPAPVKDKEGNVTTPEDTRQPPFLEGGLPGLIGAWKAEAPVEGGTAPAYFYLLSNFDLWLDPDRVKEAQEFHTHAVSSVMSGLNVPRPPDQQWKTESYPNSRQGYNLQRSYSVASVTPEIEGRPYDGTFYLHTNRDIQVILLTLTPQGMKAPIRTYPEVSHQERMALALETFSTTGARPTKRSTTGGAPASGPKF